MSLFVNKLYSKPALLVIDMIMLNLSLYGSFVLRFDTFQPFRYQFGFIPVITIIGIGSFYISNLYNRLWKYASIGELKSIVKSAAIINLLFMTYAYFFQINLPRSIPLINFMLIVLSLGGLRFALRIGKDYLEQHKTKEPESNVLIIGAGDAAEIIIREMNKHPELNKRIVGLIDDDPAKRSLEIHGIKVVGNRYDIPDIISENNVDEVIIAIPSAPGSDIKEIYKLASRKDGVAVKTVPGMYEILQGEVNLTELREVKVEDLLRRDPVELKTDKISSYINGKRILVTGGGGSIGSELCRQVARFDPRSVIIFDIYENNAYLLKRELNEKYPDLDVFTIIGDVRDPDKLNYLFARLQPEVVFHAAAHKHVPLMENNPGEAVKNNIFGTKNVATMADRYGTDKFVLISTDKAVNPTNVMGATKRVAEMIIQDFDKRSRTDFTAVRFGNVLGSCGSVVPIFKDQIAEGGPVTVTHEEVTRYFMTIPEAVQLVMQAGSISHGGEVFVLDMGEPVKIIDLARDLISLSGYEPGVDIEIEIIGLRPGEKLYEELMSDSENNQATEHERIFISDLAEKPEYNLMNEIEKLWNLIDRDDNLRLIDKLKDLVKTYQPNRSNVREIIFDEEFQQDMRS
ncbi:MAG: polysaccharide biosynthesis protein [Halarsenatibacteraceae bacterium]